MKPGQTKLRRPVKIVLGIAGLFAVAFLVCFPGRQTPIALTLATGIGVNGLQTRVDQMEEKAINAKDFTDSDKAFLRDLYTCFAKGGRLTVVLRQSSQMMRRYLSKSGEDLRTNPRVFVNSAPVQWQMTLIKDQIVTDIHGSKKLNESYPSDTFYMGDPAFFDSFVGLYFGRVIAAPGRIADRHLTISWRAECPWEWPSYASLFRKHGEHHAQCFSLPNVLSILLGPQRRLQIDDGLGGHLVTLGIAKPFLVWSEWTEEIDIGQ